MPQFRAIIERAIEGGAFPGASVYLGREKDVVWSGAVGRLGHETEFHESVCVGTLYDIASLSKIYTLAAALCALSEASIAPESTPLSAFLPGFDPRISLEHLFNHSSGIVRHLQTLESLPAGEWVETLSRETLQTEPGRVVLYNCSNYFLLARALEK
ncbi:class C beta-lactamase-related serine hydrolase, partial [bacterium]